MNKTMVEASVNHAATLAGDKVMGKIFAAHFTGGNWLVKLTAEDRGLFRFQIVGGKEDGIYYWIPISAIQSLREATKEEIENKEIKKHPIKVY